MREPIEPCTVCYKPHPFKTWHLDLDDEGGVIVSVAVLERMKEVFGQALGGFAIVDEVKRPPSQIIVIPETLRLIPHAIEPGARRSQMLLPPAHQQRPRAIAPA